MASLNLVFPNSFAKRLYLTRFSYGVLTGRPGISRPKFAREIGCEKEAYARWERAETVPRLDSLCRLRKVTGVSLDYLLADHLGDDVGPPTPEVLGACQVTFGERLWLIRDLSELTVEDAARRLDVAEATYRRWETNDSPMPDAKIEAFVRCFGASLTFLQEGRPDGLPPIVLALLLQRRPPVWLGNRPFTSKKQMLWLNAA